MELGDEWTIAGSRQKDCNFQMKESGLILMILIKKGAIWLKILTKSCQIVDNKTD